MSRLQKSAVVKVTADIASRIRVGLMSIVYRIARGTHVLAVFHYSDVVALNAETRLAIRARIPWKRFPACACLSPALLFVTTASSRVLAANQ